MFPLITELYRDILERIFNHLNTHFWTQIILRVLMSHCYFKRYETISYTANREI